MRKESRDGNARPPVIALRLPQLGSLAVMIELIRTDIIVTADRKPTPDLRVVGGLKHEGK